MEGRFVPVPAALVALVVAAGCANDGSTTGRSGGARDAAPEVARGSIDVVSPDAPGALRFFTGTLDGTDARIGVVAAEHHARLYFCGGDSTYTTLSRWVPAAVAASGQLLPDTAAETSWVVEGTLASSAVDGSLRPDDASAYQFRAERVDERTIAGLYEGTSPCGKVGLIVSQSSPEESPVAQGACITSTGDGTADVHQVNPVAPLTRAADGTIAVQVAGTSETLRLTPALVAD